MFKASRTRRSCSDFHLSINGKPEVRVVLQVFPRELATFWKCSSPQITSELLCESTDNNCSYRDVYKSLNTVGTGRTKGDETRDMQLTINVGVDEPKFAKNS
jgi:hypothetical protein